MISKRILSVIIICILMFCMVQVGTIAAEKEYIYLSIEKFSIGQGSILEPTRIKIDADETVQSLLEKAVDADKLVIINSQYGDYLDGIKDSDETVAAIPQFILDQIENETVGDRALKGTLSSLDYTSQGGWFYALNNEGGAVAMGECKLKDGDVVRIMYSVYGYGTDIGFGFDAQSQKSDASYIDIANRDELIKAIADAKVGTDKNTALAVLQNLESTKVQIDGAVKALNQPTQTPQTGDCMVWIAAISILISAVVFKKTIKKMIRK